METLQDFPLVISSTQAPVSVDNNNLSVEHLIYKLFIRNTSLVI